MKIKFLLPSLIALTFSLFTLTVKAQDAAKKDTINLLKTRQELLKQSALLNKLKLKLVNLELTQPKIDANLVDANERAAKSATESRDLASKMAANTGDEKAARNARRAARDSYSDTKKAEKMANSQQNNTKAITDLKKDIEKLEKKIAKMDEQLKFYEQP